jgi:hypothetical protein
VSRVKIFRYETEAAMCQAFIEWAEPKGWEAYPETEGFDIVMVRKADGAQIGVEAKQQLNPHVCCQVIEGARGTHGDRPGPDFRAVLVPAGGTAGLDALASLCGITVIRALDPEPGPGVYYSPFNPDLPALPDPNANREWDPLRNLDWWDWCPVSRLKLPEYKPDVVAGASAPIALTYWKIRAIKIAILVDKRGFVTPRDFKDIDISMSRWTQGGWLVKGDIPGHWRRGPYLPDFRLQHPVNFAEIEADFEKWAADLTTTGEQGGLFDEGVA